MSEYYLSTETEEIPVAIVRSRRKTMAIEIKNGQVLARMPLGVKDEFLIRYLRKHQAWILKNLAVSRKQMEQQAHAPSCVIPPLSSLSSDEKAAMTQFFVEKTAFHARRMGLTYGRITIRNQKTRWGSCSAKGNLNFNYQLYYLPEECADYVVVHELAHRVHMNHSKEFWKLVEYYCPEYQKIRQRMKETVVSITPK